MKAPKTYRGRVCAKHPDAERYVSTDKCLQCVHERNTSDAMHAYQKKYRQRPETKAKRTTPEYKAAYKERARKRLERRRKAAKESST